MTNRSDAAYRRNFLDIEAPRVDAKAFRQGWRVVTRLDGLLAAGRITPGTWQACAEYRSSWDAIRRVSPGTAWGVTRIAGYGGGGAREAPLDRIRHVRLAEAAIGARATDLTRWCCVEHLAWTTIGDRLGVRDVTACKRTVDALERLALAWRRVR
jgi:hypothetical protein